MLVPSADINWGTEEQVGRHYHLPYDPKGKDKNWVPPGVYTHHVLQLRAVELTP